jgi:hypothetical protein
LIAAAQLAEQSRQAAQAGIEWVCWMSAIEVGSDAAMAKSDSRF